MADKNRVIADLFSNDREVQGQALAGVAAQMAEMVRTPGWSQYMGYVERLRAQVAIDSYAQGSPHDGAGTREYTAGYLAGLQDSIDSAVNLAKKGREAIDAAEKEVDRKTVTPLRFHPTISGKGGGLA